MLVHPTAGIESHLPAVIVLDQLDRGPVAPNGGEVNAHRLDGVQEHGRSPFLDPRTPLGIGKREELVEMLAADLFVHFRDGGLAEALDEGAHPAEARVDDAIVENSPGLAHRRDGGLGLVPRARLDPALKAPLRLLETPPAGVGR